VKVLIVGGGAREHAIAWKLLQDDASLDIVAAPGNPGIATLVRCVPIVASDIKGLLALARTEQPDLTVVGPEAPLDEGIVDAFRAEGFPIFGPTRAAARIETSKRFAKDLMQRAGVPTAHASHHSTVESAIAAARQLGAPFVVKASGLAAGKGVVVAESLEEGERAIREMLEEGSFGDAGKEILIEEFMRGEELSLFAVCDGTQSRLMIGVQDHKRLGDGDTGPNTGGMGAYAPVSLDTPELRDVVSKTIIERVLAALAESGSPFTGLLYAGLMLTTDGPKVVEFNCRFGDPETQAILPLMASSLLRPMLAVARDGSLAGVPEFEWLPYASATTVLAAAGYPGKLRKGDAITFPAPEDGVYVFHAGTRVADATNAMPPADPQVATDGGRVLSVTAVASTLATAAEKSKRYAQRITFAGKQMRGDIGWRELEREQAVGAE
jgi:phosphoribosylamine--glycine ligase